MRMIDLIIKKRSGLKLSSEEFEFIANGAAHESIPDYQLSSWLMACFLNPLNDAETADLTKAMAFSGERLDLGKLSGPKVDKHSTGGIGDGVSIALAPLVACAGINVPMMSGRGLGHTGGTLDKLESIKGFKIRLSPPQIRRQMKALGVCMFGQTQELAPADGKLYSLRDASGSVESRPLIVASILSKKYVEGIDGLVMDVKHGGGALISDFSESRKLAVSLVNTAKLLGIRCVAVLSSMEQPLGKAIGNALEIEQSVRMLRGEKVATDFEELTFELGAWMVYLGKKAASLSSAKDMLKSAIKSGKAAQKMRDIIKWQGGDPRVVDQPRKYLPKAKFSFDFKSEKAGFISSLNAREIGLSAVVLGAGRNRMEDVIDYGAGIMLEKKTGDSVRQGEIIARLYSSEPGKLMEGKARFAGAVKISPRKINPPKLIRGIVK